MGVIIQRPNETVDTGYRGAAAVTPADGTDLANWARALAVTVAGNVNVDMWDGQTVVIPVVVGINRIAVRRVRATSTTATGIVALW